MEPPQESTPATASTPEDEKCTGEAASEDFEKGVARGQLLVIMRVLRHYLGRKPIGRELAQQIGELSFSDMQELSFKMLDFESVNDLRRWLKAPDRDREPDNWVDRLKAEAFLQGRREFFLGVLRRKLGQELPDPKLVETVEDLSLSKVDRLLEEYINLDDSTDFLQWFTAEVR